MTARQQQPQGASYVIRFERGSRHSPSLAGKFLGWVGGYFTPCAKKESAAGYAATHIAKEIALRAEIAYPGARFQVLRADALGACK
jgi:hypothetical protein